MATKRLTMWNTDGTVRLTKSQNYFLSRGCFSCGHMREQHGKPRKNGQGHSKAYCVPCKRKRDQRYKPKAKTSQPSRRPQRSTSKMTEYVDSLPKAKPEEPQVKWRPSGWSQEPNTTPGLGRTMDHRMVMDGTDEADE